MATRRGGPAGRRPPPLLNRLGQIVHLSLSDVAFGMVGDLGRIAEAQLGGPDQPKDRHYLYVAFGHDLENPEQRRLMVVALSQAVSRRH
jgi:hypothetical protein